MSTKKAPACRSISPASAGLSDGILPFVPYPPVLSWESVVYSSWFNKSKFDEERDCMGKAILAMIVTVIVGYISGAIFANWVNAPEWGVILAVAVMGAFIIYFNDKKQ